MGFGPIFSFFICKFEIIIRFLEDNGDLMKILHKELIYIYILHKELIYILYIYYIYILLYYTIILYYNTIYYSTL